MIEKTTFEKYVGRAGKLLGTTSAFSHSDSEVIDWMDNVNPPTDEALNAKIAELELAEPLRILRLQRNTLLSATDWQVLPDLAPSQAVLDYRQALRDLPSTAIAALDENGQLTGVTWPTKPE
jgi:hypothetical protein